MDQLNSKEVTQHSFSKLLKVKTSKL